jgi:hypothetical protein
MVLFDSRFRTKYRSLVKKSRAEKIRCVRLDDGLYFVARKAKGHGRYIVQVDATDSGMFATCRTIRGAACPSFGVCVHLASVFEKMVAEGHRIGRREAAA